MHTEAAFSAWIGIIYLNKVLDCGDCRIWQWEQPTRGRVALGTG